MAITQKEIAYLCGVSRGTVDRVLNNRGAVKSETAQRIKTMAESMGYRSNAAARSLSAAGRQLKIGILVNAIGHQYYAEIMAGMIKALEDVASYNITGVIKLSSGLDVDMQLRLLNELMDQGVNAVAITPANDPRVAGKLREFSAKGIPVVVVSAILDGFDPFAFVGCNHYLSGRIAGGFAKQILPDGGRIAVLTSSYGMTGLNRRVAGFQDVIRPLGQAYVVLDPVQSFDDDVIAYKALSDLISRHQDISMFFLAAGGYNGGFQALNDAGLLGEVKILAFDVQDAGVHYLKKGYVAALFNQHPRTQGRHAVKILADYLLVRAIPAKRENYEPIEILIDESFYEPLAGS